MYNFKEIEKKWQLNWEKNKTFRTTENKDKKFYVLDMFPYPSGQGLHVGHLKGYTATDIVARMKRLQNYDVLHPIGFDAFGLPAEQYAIKTNNHPNLFTKNNIDNFRKQIKSLGFSYDWDREINTTDEKYYKWTQWIFKKLYENDLASIQDVAVNWCPICKTVYANEEVINGKCERFGHDIEKKPMKQWVLKITKYAEKLLDGLDDLDWPESLKEMQRNWIGKSTGTKVLFEIENSKKEIKVFTTRIDTIYGVSFLALAPEHSLAKELITKENEKAALDYIQKTSMKDDVERTNVKKEKTGVFTGSYAINPVNNQKIPIFLADYVLESYGYGAIMGVPAHDQRDFDFAKKYDLEIKFVMQAKDDKEPFLSHSNYINSDLIMNLDKEKAINKMNNWLKENKKGEPKTTYKLRDWLFSRQRYWGEPFPLYYDVNGEIKLIDDNELPVKLPQIENFQVKDGVSPLESDKEWLSYKNGTRETNTMPQWAGSCWYYLRYIDPLNDSEFANFEKLEKWLPVDLYIGGAEHAVLHLLYARFWHKVLYDLKLVPTSEPFYKLFNQGMILGENNEKMSKSKGNVVNPDEIVNSHGADTLRMYEMFMGPLEASIKWQTKNLDGISKFLDRIWRISLNQDIKIKNNNQKSKEMHKLIKEVSSMYEKLSFNTAISKMMEYINFVYKQKFITLADFENFLILLNPIAPHISEEINQIIFKDKEIAHKNWPEFDEKLTLVDTFEILVQVNSKPFKRFDVDANLTKEELEKYIINLDEIKEFLKDKEVKKIIIVPKRLVNIII